jgi:hypothetical protein
LTCALALRGLGTLKLMEHAEFHGWFLRDGYGRLNIADHFQAGRQGEKAS